ncbi:hypothetical protein MPPM_3396 [Methylorubrum populi]|jgi:hypothetical protein|uniref:Uncharacterized protein n=1 Tax=Methylorubrum populi TaxID=223967 RepID=A0A160PIZ9_9HYPH|nr:hypothetical protein [Methylorubrum populi]BAU92001.1 hypothetical protein MPPM_3396 [Methylorubrum populi]
MPRFPLHGLTLLALAGVSAPTAWAQSPPAGPPRLPTTWEALDQSMSALLNGGHRIVSATGPSFTLERQGRYVVCEVRPPGGLRGNAEATSTCHRVN